MKLPNNLQGWLCAAVAVATMSLGGNLLAETKTENEAKPKLFSVSPDSVYANSGEFMYPVYQVLVSGANFASVDKLKIYLNDREVDLTNVAATGTPPKKSPRMRDSADKQKSIRHDKGPEVYIKEKSPGSQFTLWINQNHYQGTVDLKVGNVGASTSVKSAETTPTDTASVAGAAMATTPVLMSDESAVLVLAKWNPGWWFKAGALLLSVIVLGFPVWLIKRSGQSYKVPNKDSWIVAALFLDKETATYSLSKFQFYVWTAAAVFGYIYLWVAHGLVQGVWSFLEIPGSIPGIVGISALTGATAQFVTTQRGPKGAGDEHPAYADFVASGGVVVAERFQFFVWTIIGVLAFFALIIVQDPASIRGLPKVPDGFLQLMGISSLGYLAGKFARSPGPIIDDVSVTPPVTKIPPDTSEPLKLTLRGRILSEDATFKITYKTVNEKGEPGPEQEAYLKGEGFKANIVDVDEQSKPARTGKTLRLDIPNHKPEWLRGVPKLTISNPDGQSATWPFPGMPEIVSTTPEVIPAPPTPTPPPASPATPSLKLTLNGRNLAQTAKFSIDKTELDDKKLPLTGIKTVEPDEGWQPPRYAKKLELTISNPDSKWISPGEHTLTIVNPDGQSAEAKYTIA